MNTWSCPHVQNVYFYSRIYSKVGTRMYTQVHEISRPPPSGPQTAPGGPKTSPRPLQETNSIYSNSRSTAKWPLPAKYTCICISYTYMYIYTYIYRYTYTVVAPPRPPPMVTPPPHLWRGGSMSLFEKCFLPELPCFQSQNHLLSLALLIMSRAAGEYMPLHY